MDQKDKVGMSNLPDSITAHIIRRIIHFNIFWIPILYYFLLPKQFLGKSIDFYFIFIALFIFISEMFRLNFRWKIYGQRDYEKTVISAFAWGTLGILFTLLFAPPIGINNAAIGMPLIFGLAWIDPFLGELRLRKIPYYYLYGLIGLMLIWLLSYYFLCTPLLKFFRAVNNSFLSFSLLSPDTLKLLYFSRRARSVWV